RRTGGAKPCRPSEFPILPLGDDCLHPGYKLSACSRAPDQSGTAWLRSSHASGQHLTRTTRRPREAQAPAVLGRNRGAPCMVRGHLWSKIGVTTDLNFGLLQLSGDEHSSSAFAPAFPRSP